MSDILMKYGDRRDLEDLPPGKITRPSIAFRSRTPKRQLVPYNARRGLELMMRRDPLPPVFTSLADVMDIPEATVGRDKLVIKHSSAEELMRNTRNDEG